MDQLASAADRIKKRRFLKRWSLMYELHALKKFYHLERGPRDWNFETFVDFMIDFAEFRQRYRDNKARSQGRIQKAYRVLMLASMHFQDAYNYQLDRLRRCVIILQLQLRALPSRTSRKRMHSVNSASDKLVYCNRR